jgi:hypothetical protein
MSILETLANLISVIKTEELISKILLSYYLICLKFDEIKILDKIVNFKYFELFIVKSFISCTEYNDDLFDMSVFFIKLYSIKIKFLYKKKLFKLIIK